ncbi:MAG: glycerophosphodiester phosphodiesterase [Gammaproteobacteria bacterium]|jgi:glycerophosphoryl diester phosphodiesterase|nr:glycerophosphodiester phosphodiesterase [Gammaproteobacteria bacterium]
MNASEGLPDILRQVWSRARKDWKRYLVLHLIYTGFGVVLLAPLTGALVRFIVGLSGHPALADQDILGFALTLPGLASMILIAAVLITVMALEQVSLMSVAVGSVRGREVNLQEALLLPVVRAGEILSFAMRLVVRVLVLVAPFLAVAGVVAWSLLTDHDINYYLSERPPAFWGAVTLSTVVLLAMTILLVRKLIGWSLALLLVLFSGETPAGAFTESEHLLSGGKRRLFVVFLVWALVVLLLGVILGGVIQILGMAIVPQFQHSLKLVVAVLGGLFALWSLGNLFVTAFGSATFALILTTAYEHFGPGVSDAVLEKRQGRRAAQGRGLSLPGFLIALGVVAVVAVGTGAWLLKGVRVDDDVAIVAHRGAAGKSPENTLASVRQAIEDETDWVEIDVQETADGEVVVVHDSDFMKIAGVPINIWDATLEQIREIDVGSSFDPRFSGERTPTLREVLETARGKALVAIELKYYGHDDKLERRVVDLVEALGMVPEVAIMSLRQAGIEEIRRLRPDWPAGLLTARALGDLTKLDVDFLAVNAGMATPGFIRRAHAADREVWVWTINDPVTMSRMTSLGVDGIITDEPEMAREVLNDRAGMSTIERLIVHVAILFGRPVPPRSYRDDSP